MRYLLLLCLLCGGCMRAGTAQTVFSLGTAAVATENLQPRACLWVLGSMGGFRGMSLIIAHGNVTLDECVKLHAPLSLEAAPTPQP